MAEAVRSQTQEPGWKLAAREAARRGLFAFPLVAAGRLDWARGWIFFALIVLTEGVNLAVMRWKNPALLRERLKKRQHTRRFDKAFIVLHTLVLLALFIVAGLDAGRLGWSSLPIAWFYAGVALHVAGEIPVAWAMATNPYLEPTVRIQEERGHRVIMTGPYRFIRHPMYAGVLVMASGWPLVLGSAWAYAPYAALAILVIFRAAFEDQTLRKELFGYEAYSHKTRYRLVPGVW